MSNTRFVILSFEGPDAYAHIGGLGTRVTELSRALARLGFETHLFFVGDPDLPGHQCQENGRLRLHRWCQWISRQYPAGVYDGEEVKLADWTSSLPEWLESNLLEAYVAAGDNVVVLGEEWQTVPSLVGLHEILARRGWLQQVPLFWNANNTFSFHRIPWERLKQAATITTVSRYMKHVMWAYNVDPWVVPNGIPDRWVQPAEDDASVVLPRLLGDRLTLVKVARWDPDKRWYMAVDAVAEMKRRGQQPLFLARGGAGPHGDEVLTRAVRQGLRVAHVERAGPAVDTLAGSIRPELAADMIVIQSYLTEPQRRELFHSAHGVLANSGVEPFGLVGLETMAVGGVAFVGSTGEDYVTPGHDAISLQSDSPTEIVYHTTQLRGSSELAHDLRRAARVSAGRYTWPAVIQRNLLPLLEQLGVDASHRPQGPEQAP